MNRIIRKVGKDLWANITVKHHIYNGKRIKTKGAKKYKSVNSQVSKYFLERLKESVS